MKLEVNKRFLLFIGVLVCLCNYTELICFDNFSVGIGRKIRMMYVKDAIYGNYSQFLYVKEKDLFAPDVLIVSLPFLEVSNRVSFTPEVILSSISGNRYVYDPYEYQVNKLSYSSFSFGFSLDVEMYLNFSHKRSAFFDSHDMKSVYFRFVSYPVESLSETLYRIYPEERSSIFFFQSFKSEIGVRITVLPEIPISEDGEDLFLYAQPRRVPYYEFKLIYQNLYGSPFWGVGAGVGIDGLIRF